jgi:hypothetical protein
VKVQPSTRVVVGSRMTSFADLGDAMMHLDPGNHVIRQISLIGLQGPPEAPTSRHSFAKSQPGMCTAYSTAVSSLTQGVLDQSLTLPNLLRYQF